MTPSGPPHANRSSVSTTQDDTQALSFQRSIVARLLGKACLGIGFIIAIVGVTTPAPVAVRTGLALLLVGVIASFVSLVQDFRHRRLLRRSSTDSAGPTTGRPSGPS